MGQDCIARASQNGPSSAEPIRQAPRSPAWALARHAVHVLGADGIWREYHMFRNRADAERSVIGFEAEGFRAKIYRTASWPIEKDAMFKAIIIAQPVSDPGHDAAPARGVAEPRARRLLAG